MAVVAAAAVMLTIAVWAVVGSRHRAGLLALAVVLLVAAKPVVAAGLELGEASPPAAIVLLVALTGAVALSTRILLSRGTTSGSVTRGLNIVAALGLSIALIQAVVGLQPAGSSHARAPASGPRPYPDIFLIIVDAYPGSPTLERVYGFDNEPFLQALEERGFTVPRDTHSNYWFTSMTLASMLNFEHVLNLDRAQSYIDGSAPFQPGWRQLINDNRVFEVLRDNGYSITATASGWTELALRGADRFIDSGQMNDLEQALWRGTYAGDVLDALLGDFVVDQHRERVGAILEQVRQEARVTSDTPRFLVAHLPIPHRPFAYEADGGVVPWSDSELFYATNPSDMGVSSRTYGRLLVGQLQYMNSPILELVDDIKAESDEPPVILLMSDHGPGNPSDPEDVAARLHNLMAVYTPGVASPPADLTPVNLLSHVLNAYLGLDIPATTNEAYAVGMVIDPDGRLTGISEISPLSSELWKSERESPGPTP